MKVAFDENVPIALVRVFQTFAKEKQFRKLVSEDFEIKSAVDYTPKPHDPDHRPKDDEPWLKRFAADGGKVVISGDARMKLVPHERLALIECGFVVIFFDTQWCNWKFWRKCALLLHWWPVIAAKIKRARKASFYHIPCNYAENGKLRWVSNKDPRLLKIERRELVARRRKKPPKSTPPSLGDAPLFEYAKMELERVDVKEAARQKPASASKGKNRRPSPI